MRDAARRVARKSRKPSGSSAPDGRSVEDPGILTHAATAVLAKFRVVFGAAREHNAAIEQACGIGGPALRALAIVQRNPGLRVTALARELMVRQPTASNIVDELVEAGLLARRRAALDQRAVELLPTAKAARVLARAPGPLLGVLPDALLAMPAEDLARLGAALDQLIAVLQHSPADARFQPMARP